VVTGLLPDIREPELTALFSPFGALEGLQVGLAGLAQGARTAREVGRRWQL
jgi:hypothetical protein